MQDLVAEIDRAMRGRGPLARPDVNTGRRPRGIVRDMRRGCRTSVERFPALRKVPDLAFYAGPGTMRVAVGERRPEDAMATAWETRKDTDPEPEKMRASSRAGYRGAARRPELGGGRRVTLPPTPLVP